MTGQGGAGQDSCAGDGEGAADLPPRDPAAPGGGGGQSPAGMGDGPFLLVVGAVAAAEIVGLLAWLAGS